MLTKKANNRSMYNQNISGNTSEEVKMGLASVIGVHIRGYNDNIGGRIKIISADVQEKTEEPQKLEGKVVCELTVEKDMVNNDGSIHGACSAYLVDICSTLPIIALGMTAEKRARPGVSQVMELVYHSPAVVGDQLRIVATTISLGSRAMSSRCEIWNKTHHRLVSSGIHVKMDPSGSKL